MVGFLVLPVGEGDERGIPFGGITVVRQQIDSHTDDQQPNNLMQTNAVVGWPIPVHTKILVDIGATTMQIRKGTQSAIRDGRRSPVTVVWERN